MNELIVRLREEIAREGIISFERFMESALYSPGLGYYERARPLGRAGDFYTNVSVGSLFGELLAYQFAEWLEGGGQGAEVRGQRSERGRHLVEAGAHGGDLAGDILDWLEQNRPELFVRLEYWIVEPSVERRDWQAEKLERFKEQVRWGRNWSELPAISGVIFSNELLDAFPVRRVGWDAQGRAWFEWGVIWRNDRFDWARMEGGAEWPRVPTELLAVLPDGFTTELNPAAERWWREAGERLAVGKLVTFDYGLRSEEFFTPERGQGTVRAYRQHQVHGDVLGKAGEQDLTAHVNFSALQAAGESVGLGTEGLWRQARFLVGVARKMWGESGLGEWSEARRRQFQTLVSPQHLGHAFRVLAQERDCSEQLN